MRLLCCFGFSRQNSCKFIAILDLVSVLLGLIMTILLSSVILYPEKWKEWVDNNMLLIQNGELIITDKMAYDDFIKAYNELMILLENKAGYYGALLVLLIMFGYYLLELWLAILLLKGSKSKHVGHCKLWINVRGVLLALLVLSFAGHIFIVISEDLLTTRTIIFIIVILYQIYCLLLVKSFIHEIELRLNYQRGNCDDPSGNRVEIMDMI